MRLDKQVNRDSPHFPLSTAVWSEHFRQNAMSKPRISWEGMILTPQERTTIAKSVQTFQLGESGEGRHLIQVARKHAAQTGDYEYVTAVELFVAEEQQHAHDLGEFLDAADILWIREDWTDRIFRRLRHLAGLELTISVLLTAELLANVYYAALREATACTPLRQLCNQILRDEAFHVHFQAGRLAILRRCHRRWPLPAIRWLFPILFWGAAVVLWLTHHRVFRAAHLTIAEYCRRAGRELCHALRLMNSKQVAHTTAKPRRLSGKAASLNSA